MTVGQAMRGPGVATVGQGGGAGSKSVTQSISISARQKSMAGEASAKATWTLQPCPLFSPWDISSLLFCFHFCVFSEHSFKNTASDFPKRLAGC